MARFKISALADADLDDIWHFIADDSEEQADKFVRILTEKFELLAKHPLIGAMRDDFRAGLRSLAYKNYVVFYMPTEYGIQIDRVLHGARDIPTIFHEESE